MKKLLAKDYKNQHEAMGLVGKKVTLNTNCTYGSGYKKGDSFYVTRVSWGSPIYIYDETNRYTNLTNCSLCDVTEKDLLEEKEHLLESIKEIDMKLSFIRENNLKVWDDDQFKVFKALSIIENSSTKLEKAKAIAELLHS